MRQAGRLATLFFLILFASWAAWASYGGGFSSKSKRNTNLEEDTTVRLGSGSKIGTDPYHGRLNIKEKAMVQDVLAALRNGVKRPDLARVMEGSHTSGEIFKELSMALDKGEYNPALAKRFDDALKE